MESEELEVPYGLNSDNRLIHAKDALKGLVYRCPSCDMTLNLRAGTVRVKHFAHKVTATCNPETIIHRTAKRIAKMVLEDWISGTASSPVLKCACVNCGEPTDSIFPKDFDRCELEMRTETGRIVDLAAMKGSNIEYAVEICHTNEVRDDKAQELSMAFIELEAKALLNEPYVWNLLRDELTSAYCTKCSEIGAERQALIKAYRRTAIPIAEKYGVELPSRFYRFRISTCWNCETKYVVFGWPANVPLQNPIPRTIQRRATTHLPERELNVCPKCNQVYAEAFLFSKQKGGPLSVLNPNEMTRQSYDRDMEQLILNALG